MTCESCGKTCIRNSARQKYCKDCADKRIKEIDRKRATERYNKHKDDINPRRNELRKLKGDLNKPAARNIYIRLEKSLSEEWEKKLKQDGISKAKFLKNAVKKYLEGDYDGK